MHPNDSENLHCNTEKDKIKLPDRSAGNNNNMHSVHVYMQYFGVVIINYT